MTWLSTFFWIVVALGVLIFGNALGSWLSGVIRTSLEQWELDPQVRMILVRLVRPIVILLAAVIALDIVGIDATILVVILGAIALAIPLSLREPVSNVVSGALLLSRRPFRVGDLIKVNDVHGVVLNLGLSSTRIKSISGRIVIPNSLVLNNPIINYSRENLSLLEQTIPCPITQSPEEYIALCLGVLGNVPSIQENPEPEAVLTEIAGEHFCLTVRGWVMTEHYFEARDDLLRQLANLYRDTNQTSPTKKK